MYGFINYNEPKLTCCSLRRRRAFGNIYPKGYVEVLESQQAQLVTGLQKMYHRLLRASAWNGKPLDESDGHPLTHDILDALSLLKSKCDDYGALNIIEEGGEKLQSSLSSEGAGSADRTALLSPGSDSEHSHRNRPRTLSSNNQPVHLKPSQWNTSHKRLSATSSPRISSTIQPSRQQLKPQQNQPDPLPIDHSPIDMPTFTTEPQLHAPGGPEVFVDIRTPEQIYQTNHAIGTHEFQSLLSQPRDQPLPLFDSPPFKSHFSHSQMQTCSCNGSAFFGADCLSDINNLGMLDPASIAFNGGI